MAKKEGKKEDAGSVGDAPIGRLTTGWKSRKKIVVAKEKAVDAAKYIRNMLPTSLIIQTADDPPVRGKKGRIRQPGKPCPDIVMQPFEKVSSIEDPKRFEKIMKDIGPGGRARKHAEVLRSRGGQLSFEG